jgi:small conductance mechanosensitive channel
MGGDIFGIAKSYIYTIAVGVVILLVGFALGILTKKILHRVLKEVGLNKIMGKVGVRTNLESVVSHIVSGLIYLVTIVFFLNQLGITSIVLYIVVGAILMLAILTFLVGLKDVIPNFVAWILLQRKSRIVEGHRVSVREISGRVEKVGYLETEIKTDNGDILYVPNSLFIKSKFWVKN